MSKKRASPEASNDEQTTEAVFQPEDNTKRAKLVSLSDTTLQDLPSELIECILVRAVAMEVKAMKLAKSVWKAKADLVISRLRTVSLQWNNILSTNFFRNKLDRILDGHAQQTIRWEILLQRSIQLYVNGLTSLRDDVFVLSTLYDYGSYVLNVYDRSNVVEPKAVIPLPDFHLGDMTACGVSNCVYLLNANTYRTSVIRITKDEHQFKASLWIKNLKLPKSDMDHISASANGNVIILARQRSPEPAVVAIYDANGFAQLRIKLYPVLYGLGYVNSVIQKSNGNLLLASSNSRSNTTLLEIDVGGRIIRKYQSSYRGCGGKSSEDINGRILVDYYGGRIELLDSELNLMDVAVPQLDDGELLYPNYMHYNRERHEMVGARSDFNSKTSDLITFRFTEE